MYSFTKLVLQEIKTWSFGRSPDSPTPWTLRGRSLCNSVYYIYAEIKVNEMTLESTISGFTEEIICRSFYRLLKIIIAPHSYLRLILFHLFETLIYAVILRINLFLAIFHCPHLCSVDIQSRVTFNKSQTGLIQNNVLKRGRSQTESEEARRRWAWPQSGQVFPGKRSKSEKYPLRRWNLVNNEYDDTQIPAWTQDLTYTARTRTSLYIIHEG